MSQFKINKNNFIFDEKLSWNAKGIMTYFLSRNNSEINLNEIQNCSNDSESSFREGILELEKYGYATFKED
jgi:hypothetical protein